MASPVYPTLSVRVCICACQVCVDVPYHLNVSVYTDILKKPLFPFSPFKTPTHALYLYL